MSYQEKTVWGVVIAMVVIFGYYFATVLGTSPGAEVGVPELVRLIWAVVAFVFVQVVYHIAIGIAAGVKSRRESGGDGTAAVETDERDLFIEAKGEKVGSLLLGAGVILIIGSIAVSGLSKAGQASYTLTPFMTAHALLLSMVVAEIGKGLTRLLHYRRVS